MATIVYRESSTGVQKIDPITPKEEYTNFSEEQFKEFIKLYLKDSIMDAEKNPSILTFSTTNVRDMNTFFETLPDYLLDFSTDSSRKLIMMYITSNLQYAFGVQFGDAEYNALYRAIMRIKDIDPRISSK